MYVIYIIFADREKPVPRCGALRQGPELMRVNLVDFMGAQPLLNLLRLRVFREQVSEQTIIFARFGELIAIFRDLTQHEHDFGVVGGDQPLFEQFLSLFHLAGFEIDFGQEGITRREFIVVRDGLVEILGGLV